VICIDKLEIFKISIGSFAIVDYKSPNGVETAMGILESVSDDGDVFIRHRKESKTFWGFNIRVVENYKFSPLKGDSNG
jgi:hypothetical protein